MGSKGGHREMSLKLEFCANSTFLTLNYPHGTSYTCPMHLPIARKCHSGNECMKGRIDDTG